MTIPVIAVVIAGAGLAITVIVLLVRGSFLLGGSPDKSATMTPSLTPWTPRLVPWTPRSTP